TLLVSTIPEVDRRDLADTADLNLGGAIGRAIVEQHTIHVVGEPDAIEAEYPVLASAWRRSGSRSTLAVPLVREGEAIGVLSVRRKQALPFTEKQVTLLETFADQAVIAIENTRLYGELEASNATLREALEQQTATSEVLEVISRSPTDLDQVLAALRDNARRLFAADAVSINRVEDGIF